MSLFTYDLACVTDVPRSNPDMHWRVTVRSTTRPGIWFYYYATRTEAEQAIARATR